MYNRPAYTVDPVISDDATGGDLVDLQVRQTGNSAVGRDGQYRGWQDDYTADSQGRTIFDPKDGLDELAESPVVGFDEESYTEALLESNPDIGPALSWADGNLPDELIESYNAAVDAGNLDKIHELLNIILGQYKEFGDAPEQPEQTEEVEEPLSDEEATEFAGVLDDLTVQDPGGTAAAYEWLEASQQYDSDPVMQAVCRASASFHDGSRSAADLIDDLTSRFSPRELARAYNLINQ